MKTSLVYGLDESRNNNDFSTCTFLIDLEDGGSGPEQVTAEHILKLFGGSNMTFVVAVAAMLTGNKVKLPEWTGYWYMDNNSIKVYTKDCNIIDTPHLADYKNRTDWQITDGSRDIGGAMSALKAGKRVKRNGWDDGSYLILDNTRSTPLIMPYVNNQPSKFGAWTGLHYDLLAVDWLVID